MSAVHVPKQLQPTFLTVRHSPTYATDFASSLPANTSYLCNHPAQPRRASTCRSDGRQAGASLGFPQSQSKVARELWTSLGIRTTCGRAVAELRRTAPVRPTVSLQRLSCSERNIQQRRSSRRSRCQRSTRRSAHRAKERNVRRSLGRVLPRVLRFEDCGTCCKPTCARISTGLQVKSTALPRTVVVCNWPRQPCVYCVAALPVNESVLEHQSRRPCLRCVDQGSKSTPICNEFE